ncbi:MAG: ASCH domain-containing protein [Planctomycetota bacterium]
MMNPEASSADAIHLAVVHQNYIELILRGTKTAELRLTKNRNPPHGVVHPGQRLYFKQSSGPVRATAVVTHVESLTDLTPADVARLAKDSAETVRGEPDFFEQRSSARFASVIHFDRVQPCAFGPDFAAERAANPRAAWLVLPAEADVYPDCLATNLFTANR